MQSRLVKILSTSIVILLPKISFKQGNSTRPKNAFQYLGLTYPPHRSDLVKVNQNPLKDRFQTQTVAGWWATGHVGMLTTSQGVEGWVFSPVSTWNTSLGQLAAWEPSSSRPLHGGESRTYLHMNPQLEGLLDLNIITFLLSMTYIGSKLCINLLRPPTFLS